MSIHLHKIEMFSQRTLVTDETNIMPFDMLNTCHERVERMLGLLNKIQSHVLQHGVDEQVAQAARDVMRYFDMAAPLHHQDEELHVFPAVLRTTNHKAHLAVTQLLKEHRLMELLWVQLRQLLCELTVVNKDFKLLTQQLALLQHFHTLYQSHLQLESLLAYPCAQTELDHAELKAMGHDMMHRRGVKPVAI